MTHESDTMKSQSRGLCKGLCNQYKATKPMFIGRYAADQVRCQICEIFLKYDGVEIRNNAPYCKCCHYKVRTKPRNTFYKQHFNEQALQRKNINQNGKERKFQTESTESKQEKKSTPLYNSKKHFGKTFYELKEFIENGIIAHANYQYVMLKYLISHSASHKGKIAESLAYYNTKDPSSIDEVKRFLQVPVFDVLEKSGYVIKSIRVLEYDNSIKVISEERTTIAKYYIDVDIREFQLIELDSILEKKIEEWNQEHGILIFEGKYEYGDIDWYDNRYLIEEKIPTEVTDDEKNSRNMPYGQTPKLQSADETELIIKECPKCHLKIAGKPSEDLVNRIQERFGSLQIESGDQFSNELQAYCRKCRTAENNTVKGDGEVEDISLFNIQNDGINIKVFQLKHSEFIREGQTISNDQLVSKFRVGNMGGIRYSSKNNLLILCDTESGHYQDIIDKEFQIIYFTGEGQSGDQTLSGGNQRIASSENVPMFYFIENPQPSGQKKRGALDNIYTYVGKVRYIKHITKIENDIHGNPRQAIKFLLEIEK